MVMLLIPTAKDFDKNDAGHDGAAFYVRHKRAFHSVASILSERTKVRIVWRTSSARLGRTATISAISRLNLPIFWEAASKIFDSSASELIMSKSGL